MGNALPSFRTPWSSTGRSSAGVTVGGREALPARADPRRAGVGDEPGQRRAQHLLGRVAEHGLRAPVPGHDVAVGIGGDHGVDRGLGHGAEALLALPEPLLALRDRARHPVERGGQLADLVPLARRRTPAP